MRTPGIRFKAVALFEHRSRLLLRSVFNASTGEQWFIPPGGGIEYGESSLEALKREIMEELGWQTRDTTLLGAFESFHVINGREEHEISVVYRCTPADTGVFGRNRVTAREADGRIQHYAWHSMDTLRKTGTLLYPPGLLAALDA